jgi:hypothetical protein
VRAGYLLRPEASFALARQLQQEGLPIADVFSFASGLYFRGKIAYARRFAASPNDLIRVITANAGLIDPTTVISADTLRAYGTVDIHPDDPRYEGPLRRDALALAARLSSNDQVILLGSIATGKYRDILLEVFGRHLVFPCDFVGRGDMSRGGLLLRAAREGTELPYVSVEGAVLKGKRAPRISDMKPPAPLPK